MHRYTIIILRWFAVVLANFRCFYSWLVDVTVDACNTHTDTLKFNMKKDDIITIIILKFNCSPNVDTFTYHVQYYWLL